MDKTSLFISCLCVTENRPAFMPWLLWNYDRQRWARRELVIVDSSPTPFACSRPDVRVITAPPGTGVAAKRNLALRAAQGALISWFDDDDWQHPDKLALLAEALQDGQTLYAGARHAWFVDLATGRCARHRGTGRQPIFNSAGFRRSAVLPLRFPEKLRKATDTRWLQALSRRYPGRITLLEREDLFFWLCHEANLSNPAGRRRFPQDLSVLRGIVGDAWGDTDQALAALKERLAASVNRDSLPGRTTRRAIQEPTSEPNGRGSAATVLPQALAGQRLPVTACLLSWNRPQNLQAIVNSLQRQAFIDEILVWNNNPAVDLALQGERVRVIPSAENELCYGRFLCARQARNETIFFQDDDVIVENIPALYEAFCADDSCIVHALAGQHLRRQERFIYPGGHVALLGWGSFVRKGWMGALDRYVAQHGTDRLFKREADKFFTLLQGKRHNTVRAQLQHLPGGYADGVALYREGDHELLKALAVRRALAYLRESRPVPFPVTWNVVVVCHNYGRYLEQAVRSILLNDADYVITIVDDASTDDTQAIAGRLCAQYDHIRTLRHAENQGVSRARNSGIAFTDSLFVVTLDADDRVGPDYLYEAEKLLRAGCDVANPDAVLFGAEQARWTVPPQVNLAMLLQRNRVHCAAAFRRSYWVQVGGVDETMDHWWDYDFWIRLAGAGARIRRLPGDHFFYRRHGAGKSKESATMRDRLRAHIRAKHRSLYQQGNPRHAARASA